MLPFKEWFEDRFKVPYPGVSGEELHVVMKRVADGVAEYVELTVRRLENQEEKP